MKVSRVDQILNMARTVHASDETERYDRDNKRRDQESGHKNRQKNDEIIVTDDSVRQAIDTFASDEDLKAAGMQVSMEGKGPGLKITLKDGTGTVIRQFSAEDFLRLREMTSGPGLRYGKILDEKA